MQILQTIIQLMMTFSNMYSKYLYIVKHNTISKSDEYKKRYLARRQLLYVYDDNYLPKFFVQHWSTINWTTVFCYHEKAVYWLILSIFLFKSQIKKKKYHNNIFIKRKCNAYERKPNQIHNIKINGEFSSFSCTFTNAHERKYIGDYAYY